MKPPNPPKAAAGTKYPPPLPLKPRPLPRPLKPPLSVELTPGRLVLFSVTYTAINCSMFSGCELVYNAYLQLTTFK